MIVGDLATPALVVDGDALQHNLDTMARARPGDTLRPHVKAHKCTELARAQHAAGHVRFCGATVRELIGMAHAGLGEDLLLANETVDIQRLHALAQAAPNATVAVDSEATIDAAASAGIARVLIDINVGMPRCGCDPETAGTLADLARQRGLTVRGVMGYEGHVVGIAERAQREAKCVEAMQRLAVARDLVGGDIVSAGGTGTFDISDVPNEIQAGSYALMDTAYAALDVPFRQALFIVATVISSSRSFAVADCGLKALGMDHGNPLIDGHEVWFCSDEHVTFAPALPVGTKILVRPAHVDPTAAYHEQMIVSSGPGLDATVEERWAIDLRGW